MKHTTRKNLKTLSAAILLLSLGAPTAFAGPVTVREAVEKAINTNPEVKARFHAFRDVYEEQGVYNGGYWPKVDASAGIVLPQLEMEKLSC